MRKIGLRHDSSLPGRAHGRRVGFTAIEISAVASIIAILALVLIPVMRTQVEQARITAAMDDLWSIEKAQSIAFAYHGQYFRTFDLLLGAPQGDPLRLPGAYWNRPIPPGDIERLRNDLEPSNRDYFQGPFLAAQETLPLNQAVANYPFLFRSDGGVAGVTGDGPILLVEEDEEDEQGTNALSRRRIPIDPWGAPYIFFGSGRMINDAGDFGNVANQDSAETNFSTAAVYCLGPNGLAGDGSEGIDSQHYFRPGFGIVSILGTDDDLTREF